MGRGQVRIIGGEWRGRKLAIPDLAEVRPTPDRVRVTLFNWLAALLPGSTCLDLFAGTGVLGFEALSRGAESVALVDQSPHIVRLLKEQLAHFKSTKGQVYQAKIPEQWPPFAKPFDLIFLDPPYQAKVLLPVCFALEEKGLVAETAYIYLESGSELNESELPAGWLTIKHKKAGQVDYYLVKRTGVKHETSDSNC